MYHWYVIIVMNELSMNSFSSQDGHLHLGLFSLNPQSQIQTDLTTVSKYMRPHEFNPPKRVVGLDCYYGTRWTNVCTMTVKVHLSVASRLRGILVWNLILDKQSQYFVYTAKIFKIQESQINFKNKIKKNVSSYIASELLGCVV